MSQSQTVEPELAAVQENSLVETAAMPGMMTPETSDMSSKLTAMRLPSICRTKMRPIGGCFCYIVLERVVNIRKRDLFVRHCLDAFGTNAVLGMARKCDMYVHGPIAEMDISNLVHEVNLLIPKCYPPMTPLVTFKPVMYASGR